MSLFLEETIQESNNVVVFPFAFHITVAAVQTTLVTPVATRS
jgi:hypothetical protein